MTRALLVLGLAVLWCGSSVKGEHAGPAHARVEDATVGPLSLTLFQGSVVSQDAPGAEDFAFLDPNEVFGSLFENCLQVPNGALITVGAFRGLNTASSGKVSHLVMMDFNRGIQVFNLVNLQLISRSKDRWEYLSLLLTGQRDQALIDEARGPGLSEVKFVERLLGPLGRRLDENIYTGRAQNEGIELGRKWRRLGVRLPRSEDWDLLQKPPPTRFADGEHATSPIERHLYDEKKFRRALERFERRGTLSKTLFGDDTRFERVKRLIEDGRVTVVSGDAAGDKTLRSLAEVLRAKNVPVAAVDLSNVPGVFTRGNGLVPRVAFAKVARNLRSFKWETGSRIFFTEHNNLFGDDPKEAAAYGVSYRPELRSLNDWYYFALRPRHLNALEKIFDGLGEGKESVGFRHQQRLDAVFTADPSDSTGHALLRTIAGDRCR